jgi:hypothetical protein
VVVKLSALAAAGYRAVAQDMRAYGGADAPPDPNEYTIAIPPRPTRRESAQAWHCAVARLDWDVLRRWA